MESRESFIEKIRDAIKARDHNRAIQLANEALTEFPDDTELTSLRENAREMLEAEPFLQSFMTSGISLFNSGLYEEALKQFEKVATISPDYPELKEWLAKSRSASTTTEPKEKLQESLSEEVGKIQPEDSIKNLIAQGQKLFDQGKYEDAIQTWSEIFMHDITNRDAQHLIQKAQQAIQERQNQVNEWLKSIKEAMKNKDIEKAQSLVEKVLKVQPNNEEALQFHRTLQSKHDIGTQAIERELSPELVSDSVDQIVMEALRAHREGQWNEAVRLWQEVLKLEPDNLGAQSKYSEALRQLRMESQITKLLEDARLFMASEKRDSALHALQKAYRLRPDNPEVRNLMLSWQLTETDLESFSPGTQAEVESAVLGVSKAEAKKPPYSILGLVGVIVIAFAAFILYWKVFHSPSSNNNNVATINNKTHQQVSNTGKSKKAPSSPIPNSNPNNIPEGNESPSSLPTPSTPTVELTPSQIRQRDASLLKAQSLNTSGNVDEAFTEIQKAYSIDPTNPDVQALYNELNNIIQTREREIQEKFAEAQRYTEQLDFAGAVFILNKLRTQFPKREDVIRSLKFAYFNLGLFYLRQVRCNEAMDVLEQIELIDNKRDPNLLRFIPIAKECITQNGLSPDQEKLVFNTPYLPLTPPSPNS